MGTLARASGPPGLAVRAGPGAGARTLACVPRDPRKPRRLVADGRAYVWTLRHSHRALGGGRPAQCRQTLTLYPQPAGAGGPLRIVFAQGPGPFSDAVG